MQRNFHPSCERLESREMLSGLPEAQLFAYLVNEARHDPAAYQVASGVDVDLSDVTPRPPLAINENLIDSAQFKATEMAENDYFSHQSAVTQQWPNALARAYGYELPESWRTSESCNDNKNCVELNGTGTTRATADEHLRRQITSQQHRAALLGIGGFQFNVEIGAGYAQNPSTLRRHWWVAHIARTEPSRTFLTGVVYQDLNGNGRFDLNEGIGGQTVSVGSESARTNTAGGWSIEVARDANYQVKTEVDGKPIVAHAAVASDNRHLEFRVDSATTRLDFGDWLDSADVTPPTAVLSANDIRTRRIATHEILVTYQDDVEVEDSTIQSGNLQITGPSGFEQGATLLSKTRSSDSWLARYAIDAPAEFWTFEHNGEYQVQLLANQIYDSSQNAAPAQTLGSFSVDISDQFPNEDVDDNGLVTPLDALLVINELNAPASKGFPPRFDVNRDEHLSPIDALLVINYLNRGNGEGEDSIEQLTQFDWTSVVASELLTNDLRIKKRSSWYEFMRSHG